MIPSRLSNATLAALPPSVVVPAYDRAATRIGVVHLGAGAFHRAHQAVYVDDLLASEPDWAISAVSLHNAAVRDALQPQDGLYTLAMLDGQPHPQLRVIGAIAEVLCAIDQQPQVLSRLADPAVRLVTLTVTEKGYCLAGDGLDATHPDIVDDLATPNTPRSAIGYLVAGLRARRDAGIAPYTVLSCDNLPDNGGRLRRACEQFARRLDPALADWIEAQVAFPRSMVDSITPATDAALSERVDAMLGCADAWPIQRERYSQWVVEDWFCNTRPALEQVGVTLSNDIAGYDRAKLRLLNGAHSTLAYVGSLLDLDSVADAMADPSLAAFVATLMREDIVATLTPVPGFDAGRYIEAILARFRNPAIRHLLAQIAWDGSQKIPLRLLGTISDALAAGRRIDRLCVPVAAWMRFVVRQSQAGVDLIDPRAAELAGIGRSCNGDLAGDVARFLALDIGWGALAAEPQVVAALQAAYAGLTADPVAFIAKQ